MSAVKEPCFFASEIREENFEAGLRRSTANAAPGLSEFLCGPKAEKRFGGLVTEWSDYLRLFANAGTQAALGEASVCYLWSAIAARRIAATIPDGRILVMLAQSRGPGVLAVPARCGSGGDPVEFS